MISCFSSLILWWKNRCQQLLGSRGLRNELTCPLTCQCSHDRKNFISDGISYVHKSSRLCTASVFKGWHVIWGYEWLLLFSGNMTGLSVYNEFQWMLYHVCDSRSAQRKMQQIDSFPAYITWKVFKTKCILLFQIRKDNTCSDPINEIWSYWCSSWWI